jgi:hypothetical protein
VDFRPEVVRFLPPDSSLTDARLFASLSLSHESFSERETLPSARPSVSLWSFDPGEAMVTTRTTDFCLPKPQLRVPASRAFPVSRQSLRLGGENMLWDTFPCPVTFAFHDAKIASVGDDSHALHFLNAGCSNSP